MNLGYLAGALPVRARRFLLSRRAMPLFRTFLSGEEWPYDVCRYAGTRDLGVIFDVGANVGQTALYLREFFPRAAIHCFELASRTAATLRHNVRRFPNIHVHVRAVGRAPARMRVQLQDCSLVNSLRYVANATHAGATEEVEVTTLELFCAEQRLERIDVLKTDAQGFDLDVMHGGEDLFRRRAIPFVLTEISFEETHQDAQLFQPMHDFLRQHGFHLCGIYDQWNRGSELDCCNALYFCPDALRQRAANPAGEKR